MLKKWDNLGKDWDSINIKSVVNFSIKLDKVGELIQLISDDKKVWDIIRTIHFSDIFLFIYDV